MEAREDRVIKILKDTIPKMNDFQKGYILGIGETICTLDEAQREALKEWDIHKECN